MHVRTTLVLQDGKEFTFQEATVASLVRAYVTVKTHPQLTRIRLSGRKLTTKKDGYAEWQLLEKKQKITESRCDEMARVSEMAGQE